jgi:hypothetical protein
MEQQNKHKPTHRPAVGTWVPEKKNVLGSEASPHLLCFPLQLRVQLEGPAQQRHILHNRRKTHKQLSLRSSHANSSSG